MRPAGGIAHALCKRGGGVIQQYPKNEHDAHGINFI
jgi:hypothetical protein